METQSFTRKPRTHWIVLLSNYSIPYNDIKPFIMKYVLKRWQDSWDQQSHNKLQEMHSLVGKTPCSYVQNGKDFDLI